MRQLLKQTFQPWPRPASVSSWGNRTRRPFGSRCSCGWALTPEREKKKPVGRYGFTKIFRTLHEDSEGFTAGKAENVPTIVPGCSQQAPAPIPSAGAKERGSQVCPRCSARRGSLRSLSTRAAYFCAAVCFSLEQEGAVRGELPRERSGVLRRTAPALGAGLENLPGCSSGSQSRTC